MVTALTRQHLPLRHSGGAPNQVTPMVKREFALSSKDTASCPHQANLIPDRLQSQEPWQSWGTTFRYTVIQLVQVVPTILPSGRRVFGIEDVPVLSVLSVHLMGGHVEEAFPGERLALPRPSDRC